MRKIGFTINDQVAREYDWIPWIPESAHTLFISPKNYRGETNPLDVALPNRTRIPLNKHLGKLLRDYI